MRLRIFDRRTTCAPSYPQAQLGAFWGRVLCKRAYVNRLSGCAWLSYPQARTHSFDRIGRPKNAKSPIVGASLDLWWQERCYTVASVLQCPRHQKQNRSEPRNSESVFGTANGKTAGKATFEPLSRIVAKPRMKRTLDLYVRPCRGTKPHTHPPGWFQCDARCLQRESYTGTTQRRKPRRGRNGSEPMNAAPLQ